MRGPGPWRWPCRSAAGAGGVVCGQSRAHGHALSARAHLPSITGDQRPPLAQSPLPAQAPATRHIPEGLSLRPGWWIPQPLSPHRPLLPRVWAVVQRAALPSVSVFVRGRSRHLRQQEGQDRCHFPWTHSSAFMIRLCLTSTSKTHYM